MFAQRLIQQHIIGASILALMACEEGGPAPNPLPGDSILVINRTAFCPDSVALSVDTVEMRVDSIPILSIPAASYENRRVWFTIKNFLPDTVELAKCLAGVLRSGLDQQTDSGWVTITSERCATDGESVFLHPNGCVSSFFAMDPADTGQYRLFVSRILPEGQRYRAPFTVP